jgi:hypothetical protein
MVRVLKKFGFRTLQQVEDCIRDYNGDELSRVVWGSRRGQITRFEYMLLAGMGAKFIANHVFAAEPWFGPSALSRLDKIRKAGIRIREYDPTTAESASGSAT